MSSTEIFLLEIDDYGVPTGLAAVEDPAYNTPLLTVEAEPLKMVWERLFNAIPLLREFPELYVKRIVIEEETMCVVRIVLGMSTENFEFFATHADCMIHQLTVDDFQSIMNL
jgi:hypothetical protein